MYYLEIHEGGHRLTHGLWKGFESLAEAIAAAEKRVDDAMPSNTIHVMKDMGHAGLAGDGGTYFQETK